MDFLNRFLPATDPGRALLRAVLVLALLTIACPGRAQTAITKTNAPREVRVGADLPPTAGGTNLPAQPLTIIVLDAVTGQPVAGAEVGAPYGDWRKAQPRRLTDERGRFLLQIPTPPREQRAQMGNINVSISHSNYAGRAVAWTSSGGDVYATLPSEATVRLEAGAVIGGVVRDERGAPLAGVRVLLSGSDYRGFSMGTSEKKSHEYAQLYLTDKEQPAAVTDAEGRWRFPHFPSELETIEITLIRPDDAREAFATSGDRYPLNRRPVVELAKLKDQSAVFALKDGLTVRGMVVDETGKPVAGATVKDGYGHGNIVRASEFTTGPDGRFERQHRAPRQWIFTASAPGRATVSTIAQVKEGMDEVRLVLPPARPLSVRVIDDAKQPVKGVAINLDTYRTEAQILDWAGETDADGRAVWTNAPLVPVTFYTWSEKLAVQRKFRAAGGDAEKTLVLGQRAGETVRVKVKATDVATRTPVKVQSVSAEFNGDFSFRQVATPETNEFTIDLRRSEIRVGMYPSYRLMLKAEGYAPVTTEQMDFDEGNQEIEIALAAAKPAEGVVLLPDGKPAVGTKAWVRPNDNAGSVYANGGDRYYADRWTKVPVDASGRFKLPPAPLDQPVVFIHTNGFYQTTVTELGGRGEVRLQPWSRIDGRLTVAGQPRGGVQIYLWSANRNPYAGFQISYSERTKADGSFVFTNVPAGEFTIYRRYATRMGIITPSHSIPVEVKPGETLKVEYGGNGRTVVGQMVANAAVDWTTDNHILVSKASPTASSAPAVNREDYATFKAFQEANRASFGGRSAQFEAKNYEMIFERDGSFRVEDVPPGRYELHVAVTKPDPQRRGYYEPRPQDQIGSLIRDVTVPAGGPGEDFDLGTLELELKDILAGARPVASFKAVQLDGKPFDADSLRGKPAVVLFWANWAPQSADRVAALRKFRDGFAAKDRAAFVTVNLDEDVAAARDGLKGLEFGWTHTRLEGAARADVTEQLAVDTLPTLLVLDTQGRIAARDPEPKRLGSAMDRLLAQQTKK